MKNKRGFTLVEILVIVLIIGVLTAIALPAYKKSAEKSKVTAAINTMSAVAKSEHAWYLDHNSYTTNFTNLSIELTDKTGSPARNSEFEDINYKYKLVDAGIMAERNNKEYFIYKDYATNKIMCSPGTHYICKDLGAFTKTSCEDIDMAWANRNSTCYVDEETKCKDLHTDKYGKNIWNGDFCGYNNAFRKTLEEGMICRANSTSGCQQLEVNAGGICVSYDIGCSYGYFDEGICISKEGTRNSCGYSTFTNGGICYGYCTNSSVTAGGICMGVGSDTCRLANVYSGGIAVCEGEGSCKFANFYGTGCCCGGSSYCPNARKCDPDRCTEVLSKLNDLEALSETMP